MSLRCCHEDLMLHAYGFAEPEESAVVESHLLECASCREELARLTDERFLVSFELSLEPGVTSSPEPIPPASRPHRLRSLLLPAAGIAAALALVLVALTSLWSPEAVTQDVAQDPRPVEYGPAEFRPLTPLQPWIVFVPQDSDPDLLARVQELERLLGERPAVAEAPVHPATQTPEEAIENHDWAGLADALAKLEPDLRRGRLPDDPAVLESFAARLWELEELALVAGVPATVEEAARDPRTGPKLFAAVLAKSWPEAPGTDLARAEVQAFEAITRYREETAAATTISEREAAEGELSRVLADTVHEFEEQHGTPLEDVKEPTEIEETDRPDETDETGGTVPIRSPTATRVLTTASYHLAKPAVLTGTREEIVKQIVARWRIPGRTTEDLARSWLERYEEHLRAAPPEVAAAFRADLGHGTRPATVNEQAVSQLRKDLAILQETVERRAGTTTPDLHFLVRD